MTLRHWVAGAIASAAMLLEASASACPCRGSAGPGGALTGPLETVGGSLTQSILFVHGAWSPLGRYADLASNVRQWQIDYGLALAWRAHPRVEVGANVAYGRQSASAPGFSAQRTGFGDTTLRLRWEAYEEPMRWTGKPWPAVSAIASIRMPSGQVEPPRRASAGRVQTGTTGTVGTAATSQGLGTWEPSLAVELTRGLSPWWRLGVLGEVAFRLPDDSIGIDRRLGPRTLGQFTVTHIPSTTVSLGVMTDIGWEGDVTLDGRKRPGTTQRLWTLGAFLTLREKETGLRSGLMVRHAPPVDDINVNAARSTSVGISLGWSG